MGQWLQRLVASAKYGTVSEETVQGYLRSASQIEEVWQKVDEKVNELILSGVPAWEAHSKMGYALAYVRACRLDVILAQELLKANAMEHSVGTGKIAQVTHDQAIALCEHIEPLLEACFKAMNGVRGSSSLPLNFGPHIRDSYHPFPIAHLQGCLHGTQEMKTWVDGTLAQYELATTGCPQLVIDHIKQVRGDIDLAQFHFQTGADMVGQISLKKTTDELNNKAEGFLWEAMESLYKIIQVIAMPNASFGRMKQPEVVKPSKPVQIAHIESRPLPKPEPVKPPEPLPDYSSLLGGVKKEENIHLDTLGLLDGGRQQEHPVQRKKREEPPEIDTTGLLS